MQALKGLALYGLGIPAILAGVGLFFWLFARVVIPVLGVVGHLLGW